LKGFDSLIVRSTFAYQPCGAYSSVLGIIGSIIGGGVTHVFSRPPNGRYHPSGLIFSTLGAILVLIIATS
jgi:uncharacterized membrane protein YeaQ/YmgE (transglycosylase-associated protein family)